MDVTAPTVFVVDDESHVRRALARLIRSLGMQVETFASAREFLKHPLPDGPACLVLDVRLVGENGLQVQQALQAATEHKESRPQKQGINLDNGGHDAFGL